MREVPIKNYVILGVIVVVIIMAVFYLRNIYIATAEYNGSTSVIETVVNQINEDEISNYILENPRTILYISSGQDAAVKTFERELKNVLVNNDLTDFTLYVNKDNITDMDHFITKLKNLCYSNKVEKEIDIDSKASLYLFENSKIKYVIINASSLGVVEVKNLLLSYGMIESD